MKIISGGKKDYYDYLVGIYGMDEDIVYDRRDCEVIRDCLTTNYYLMRFFTKFVCYDDAYKAERKQYNGKWETVMVGKFYSFILEIGFTKYVYEIERYLEDGKVKIDYKLLNKFENQTKFVDAPIGIVPLRFGNQLSNGRFVDETSWDTKNFSTAETTTRTRTIEEAFKFKPRIVIRQGQVLNNLISECNFLMAQPSEKLFYKR